MLCVLCFLFQAEDVIRDLVRSRGLGDVYKRQTYTYTDSLGCSATISNFINVIFCCDTSCVVNAGPDITICEGDVGILTATGCTGAVTWYKLGVAGPVVVGQGPIIDVFGLSPGVHCYIAECCCPGPIVCCSTDTCLLYTSPSPRDRTRSRMPSSA